MAAPAVLSLESLLQRSDVWRGNGLAHEAGEGVATGFAPLDAELPGGGWPRGTLTELLSARQGVGELSLLLPALRHGADEAPVAVVAPPGALHAPAWAAQLPLSRLLVVEAEGKDVAWSLELLLGSAALSAVLAWLPDVDHKSLRRLQLAAQGSRSLAFLLRDPACAVQASPAPLRLMLASGRDSLALRILKRRGAPCDRTLALAVERPIPWARVQEKTAVAAPPVLQSSPARSAPPARQAARVRLHSVSGPR
ncbi:translesion DNA synthesis-associated protein ImuA [Niveibacterium sp. SC-1]|uniref:translesion DNA synthesis-associated protein ImuA n=1 Tax=Niveibacterium sp. SC-1 TaxID=3135646 RepID=UPI00311E0155